MSQENIERDLALARKALEVRENTLDPGRRARLWAKIDERTSAPPPFSAKRWMPLWLGLAVAAGFAAVLFFRPVSESTAPAEAPSWKAVRLAAANRLALGSSAITAFKESTLLPSSIHAVHLDHGEIELAVTQSAEPFTLTTFEVRLVSSGGHFRLSRAEKRTRVELIEGTGTLESRDGTKRTLVPGQAVYAPPLPPPETEVVQRPLPLRMKKRAVLAEKKAPPDTTVVSREENKARVVEARTWVDRDRTKAIAMAEDVLKTEPEPEIRVMAEMVLADALRLDGHLERAATTYGAVAESTQAGAFLEEAMFRQAQLLAQLEHGVEALSILKQADAKIAGGLLLPERTVLAIDLHLASGRVEEAARVLENTNGPRTRALERAAQRVAEALREVKPGEAKSE
jgi:hypothetical protein